MKDVCEMMEESKTEITIVSGERLEKGGPKKWKGAMVNVRGESLHPFMMHKCTTLTDISSKYYSTLNLLLREHFEVANAHNIRTIGGNQT